MLRFFIRFSLTSLLKDAIIIKNQSLNHYLGYRRNIMLSKNLFIKATEEFNTFENNVPAYYFRRAIYSDTTRAVNIRIAVCGLYELYLNGARITKGFLSPYISNTNDYIYYDEYDVTLDEGENVIGVLLGNGLQNNPGGHIWDFDKASFRSAPMLALTVTCGEQILLSSDTSFKTAPSPIRSDDYRFGEYYDANYEIDGWNEKGYDDSAWGNALPATPPRGELRIADVAPITKEKELRPQKITRCDDGYIYDFGVSGAGICRLSIRAEAGQRIELRYADSLMDGDLNIVQIWFTHKDYERDKDIVHKDTYVCKGGEEIYEPTFTYHGFRYVKVSGITEAQATEDMLTCLLYHTELRTRGDFTCSDSTATTLQEMTRRSILSNFHHFPTDCPQREKNGWTADAALTCEAVLMNFDPERNYREWMRNVCKAQRADGALPGIVPTDGWGFQLGNGPAWDCVLAWIPYYTYIYRGETEMIRECADSLLKYLRYIRSRCDERGLLSIGLGDWCHVGGVKPPKAPLILTDTVTSMDIAAKISDMLSAIDMIEAAEYASHEAKKYREAIRAHLIDFDTMRAAGDCQSSQAMCLYYGVFDTSEEPAAFDILLEMVHAFDDHIDVGVLGGRVIFHVLSRFGYSDLAFKMITREDYPSYGNWIKRGATTLWEDFLPDKVSSMNHHFWGDISAWFIKCIAGIKLNPDKHDVNTLKVAPAFIKSLDSASAYHVAPSGEISVSWRRDGGAIILDAKIPEGMNATVEIDSNLCFENGESAMPLTSGVYKIAKRK